MSGERKHPKELMVLFFTEMWERYNYYGMRAILVLFMTKAMLFDKVFSSNLYGSYTSLVYLTPLLGGYISDRYWGNKRSIIVGGIVMALGEFVLFFCGLFYHSNPELSSLLFFIGLGSIIAGNGFFKPNIASMVGQLYPKGDRRVDSAYAIFYIGINVGTAIGPIVCGLIGDTGRAADFKWAFLASGIGMVISVIIQRLFHNKCGELCLSPIGLSLVNKLAPFKFASLLMAVWFLANSAANKLAGVLSALYPDNKTTSFLSYQMTNMNES